MMQFPPPRSYRITAARERCKAFPTLERRARSKQDDCPFPIRQGDDHRAAFLVEYQRPAVPMLLALQENLGVTLVHEQDWRRLLGADDGFLREIDAQEVRSSNVLRALF